MSYKYIISGNEILKDKHIMRAFTRDEIVNYLVNNGFKILDFYANSLMKPYNDTSNKIIIHFEKKIVKCQFAHTFRYITKELL